MNHKGKIKHTSESDKSYTGRIVSKDNKKDIEDIPEIYIKGLEFHYVENVMDVLNYALLDEKVDDAIDFSVKEEDNSVKENDR